MSKNRLLFRWPLATLAVLLIANVYAFRWFGASYIEWFIANGTLINLLASLVTIGWADLNKNRNLISSSPRRFVSSNLLLIAVQYIVVGHEYVVVGKRLQTTAWTAADVLDSIGSLLTGAIILIAIVAWAVVVAPLQYFVVLLTGAPARLSVRAPTKIIAHIEDATLEYKEWPRDTEEPPGWWTASLNAAPVTVTQFATALFLFVVGEAVDWAR